jgi:enoyl-CoA hydratase/carnithine racemase
MATVDQGVQAGTGNRGTVHVSRENGVAHVVLDNPARYNCMSRLMWDRLEQVARELTQDASLRMVTIRGAGGHFTSGYDLSELADQPLDAINAAFSLMEAAISAVEQIPVPVVAVVDGWCLGGGLELALACDLRWVRPTARMGMPIAKLGIMLSQTFALRLVKVLGVGLAKELLFTGRIVSADEALTIGLAHRVLPQYDAAAERAWADEILGGNPLAIRQAKLSIGQVVPSVDDDTAYYVAQDDFLHAVARFRRVP